jgi:hypothetical protein
MSIPRPKPPKRALPHSLRCNKYNTTGASDHFYQPGAGVLQPKGLNDGVYRAGSQRNFLKRRSGKQLSERGKFDDVDRTLALIKPSSSKRCSKVPSINSFSSPVARPRFQHSAGTIGRAQLRRPSHITRNHPNSTPFDASRNNNASTNGNWWDRY